MLKANCVIAACTSSTYGINEWKKEPLERVDKNVVKE